VTRAGVVNGATLYLEPIQPIRGKVLQGTTPLTGVLVEARCERPTAGLAVTNSRGEFSLTPRCEQPDPIIALTLDGENWQLTHRALVRFEDGPVLLEAVAARDDASNSSTNHLNQRHAEPRGPRAGRPSPVERAARRGRRPLRSSLSDCRPDHGCLSFVVSAFSGCDCGQRASKVRLGAAFSAGDAPPRLLRHWPSRSRPGKITPSGRRPAQRLSPRRARPSRPHTHSDVTGSNPVRLFGADSSAW
jgi:hypothetical protein